MPPRRGEAERGVVEHHPGGNADQEQRRLAAADGEAEIEGGGHRQRRGHERRARDRCGPVRDGAARGNDLNRNVGKLDRHISLLHPNSHAPEKQKGPESVKPSGPWSC